MKLLSIMAMLSILTSCFAGSSSKAGNQEKLPEPPYRLVDVVEFSKAVADTNVVVLDVRTEEEFQSGSIDSKGRLGTINIDVEKSDFLEKSLELLPKDKTIALYCRSGRRSKTASSTLVDNGYKVLELAGGINAWTAKFSNE